MSLTRRTIEFILSAVGDPDAKIELAAAIDESSAELSSIQSGSNPYSESGHSHQVLGPDMNIGPAVGSNDGGNPKFIATIMGNIIGASLSNAANYLAGVIGAFSVTGAKATTYPAGAVLAQISDGVTEADGAVVAYVDGDSSLTKANAAFKAMSNNSNPGSGFDYGTDLRSPSHDGYSALSILKALDRSPNEVCRLEGSGGPVDGATGLDFAGKGSSYTNYSTGISYKNVGTKAAPVWDMGVVYKDVTITSAQLLTLDSIPVEVIPTPGTGKVILIDSVYASLDFNTTAYAFSGVIDINYATLGAWTGLEINGTFINNALVANDDLSIYVDSASVGDQSVLATNQGVVLSASNSITLGDSDIKLRIFYKVVPGLL